MKKVVTLVLCIVCIFSSAMAEMPPDLLGMDDMAVLEAMMGAPADTLLSGCTLEELQQISQIANKVSSAFATLASLADEKAAKMQTPAEALAFPQSLIPEAEKIVQYNQTVREIKHENGKLTVVVDVENGWMFRGNTITHTIRFMCDFSALAFAHSEVQSVTAEYMTEGVDDYGKPVDMMIITYTLNRATAEKMDLEYMSYSAAASHAPFLRVVNDYAMTMDYMGAIKR